MRLINFDDAVVLQWKQYAPYRITVNGFAVLPQGIAPRWFHIQTENPQQSRAAELYNSEVLK
jgi:hypothetical protein